MNVTLADYLLPVYAVAHRHQAPFSHSLPPDSGPIRILHEHRCTWHRDLYVIPLRIVESIEKAKSDHLRVVTFTSHFIVF